MLSKHSEFADIEEEHFLVGTPVHPVLEKMSSFYLKKEFWTNGHCFLEGFCSAILSTVPARSKLGQNGRCFWPETNLEGDNHSTFFLYGPLLDGLVESGWEKGSNVEAYKARFPVFFPGAEPAGASVHKEAPWCREKPGLLLSKKWTPKSPATVPDKFRITLGCTSLLPVSIVTCCRCFRWPCICGTQLKSCPISV